MTKRPGRPSDSVPPSPSQALHSAAVQLPSDRPRRGRPRLTPQELRDRLAEYCGRYSVALNDEGLPPFPAGQRETAQHREWMSLYKAHRRLSERGTDSGDLERRQALLAVQHGRCVVCRKPLDLEQARLDGQRNADAAVLHARCLELVALARTLGPEALERARSRI